MTINISPSPLSSSFASLRSVFALKTTWVMLQARKIWRPTKQPVMFGWLPSKFTSLAQLAVIEKEEHLNAVTLPCSCKTPCLKGQSLHMSKARRMHHRQTGQWLRAAAALEGGSILSALPAGESAKRSARENYSWTREPRNCQQKRWGRRHDGTATSACVRFKVVFINHFKLVRVS